jgi:hypothetical protein
MLFAQTKGEKDEEHSPIPIRGVFTIHQYLSIACPMDTE